MSHTRLVNMLKTSTYYRILNRQKRWSRRGKLTKLVVPPSMRYVTYWYAPSGSRLMCRYQDLYHITVFDNPR